MAVKAEPLVVGIRGTVVAIDRNNGKTLWETGVKGADYVTVAVQNGAVFAASRGRVYRMDPSTGDILWSNELPGLGWGLVSIAGASDAGLIEEQRRRAAAASAAAAG